MYSPIEDFGKTNENKNIQNMLCDCKLHGRSSGMLYFEAFMYVSLYQSKTSPCVKNHI